MPHRALAPQRAKTAHHPGLLSSPASSALPPINQLLLPSSMTTVFSFASSANGAIAPHTKASWRVFARQITYPSGRLQILQDLGRFVFLKRLHIGWRGGYKSYETSWVLSMVKAGRLPRTSESAGGETKRLANLELC